MATWSKINGFEDGEIGDWNDLGGTVSQTTTGVSEGTYSGEASGSTNQLDCASLDPSLQANRPPAIRFTYYETSNASDHGIAMYDGNNNLVVGAGSDNPQHEYIDSSGNVTRASPQDGAYQEITTVTFDFDWSNLEVLIIWDSASSHSEVTISIPDTNVDAFQFGSIEGGSSPTDAFYDNLEEQDPFTAPTDPRNASITVDADDQITFIWDEPSDWGGERGDYTIEMLRDGGSWVSPSGGPSTVNDDGSASYSATYTPNSDNAYNTQVGIDSSFRFRVKSNNSAGSSGWSYSSTKNTTPIPPHDPSVSGRSGTAIDIEWTNLSDIRDTTEIEYRKDSGSGYGSWKYADNDPDDFFHVDTSKYAWFTEDARYQFRIRHQEPGGKYSDWTYVDYGNAGNLFFSDDFESQDFSAWDSVEQDAEITSGTSNDSGFSGADEGTYYARLYSSGRIVKNLGDLSGESNVIVKCALAAGSLDNSSEQAEIGWYDGSTWSDIKNLNWEYNKQGWVEVTALVPDSMLSTDNRVAFDQEGGGGDFTYIDRVVVSDILDEYTTPSAPSNLDLDPSVQREISASWSLNQTFRKPEDEVETHFGIDGGSLTSVGRSNTLISYTWSNLTDGETYRVEVNYTYSQPRHGTQSEKWKSDRDAATAATILPSPTLDTATAVDADTVDLSWTKNDNNGSGEYEIYRSTDGTLGSLIADAISPSATTYQDDALEEGTTYYYTVRRIT